MLGCLGSTLGGLRKMKNEVYIKFFLKLQFNIVNVCFGFMMKYGAVTVFYVTMETQTWRQNYYEWLGIQRETIN